MGKIESLHNYENAVVELSKILDNLYRHGPMTDGDIESLTYINIFHPDLFCKHVDDILYSFGLFYKKQLTAGTLHSVVLNWYKDYITEQTKSVYTPLQADALMRFREKQYISFSAPTSTGKSYIFNDILRNSLYDVVIVVPNRALINEYYHGLREIFEKDKSVNILTFVDLINTRFCRRSIFVLTPERCNELFHSKYNFNIGAFLFDEAQLSEDESERALYFDNIVRKSIRFYPNAKILFAQPFVLNPDAQLSKHNISIDKSYSRSYVMQSVGRVFVAERKGMFSYFSIDPEFQNDRVVKCEDPMELTLKNGGTVLIYVSKNSIVKKSFLNAYGKYIDMCDELNSESIFLYINRLKEYTGGDTIANKNYYSLMMDLMRRGIVVHHGSMPLEVRSIMEEFIKSKHCRLCFATRTLEQGINMPFDVVYITTFREMGDLELKNLIGRAGRSTSEHKFDYGYVVLSQNNKKRICEAYGYTQKLNEVSCIDQPDRQDDDEYNKIKNSLKNDEFSDEYNMPIEDVSRLDGVDVAQKLRLMLSLFFSDDKLNVSFEQNKLRPILRDIYQLFLGRELNWIETKTLETALQIFIWKLEGKTFRYICRARYAFLSREQERRAIAQRGGSTDNVKAIAMHEYIKFPYKSAKYLGYLTEKTQKASDVDYDSIVADTYDFLDKLIGMNFGNVLYAAFDKLHKDTGDTRAKKMANYIRYGTDDEKCIMLMRYGLSFETIEMIMPYIEYAGEDCIRVSNEFKNLAQEVREALERYVP